MTTTTHAVAAPVTIDNQSFLLKRVQPALSGLMGWPCDRRPACRPVNHGPFGMKGLSFRTDVPHAPRPGITSLTSALVSWRHVDLVTCWMTLGAGP